MLNIVFNIWFGYFIPYIFLNNDIRHLWLYMFIWYLSKLISLLFKHLKD